MSQKASLECYQLRLFLKGVSPMIWRRILVTNSSSLADLHYVIQIAMGWRDIHLHQFDIWGKNYGLAYDGGLSFSDNARKIYLKDFGFRINERFLYEYNFFDHWEHEIRLEKKFPIDSRKTYPICIGGNYLAPPEDCGGPISFMKLKDHYTVWTIEEKLLEALEYYESEKDRNFFQETIEELRYWLTRHQFDFQKTNRQLQRYFNHQEKSRLTIEEIQDED